MKTKSSESAKKMKSWLETGFTVLLFLLLFATNPNQQDFMNYLKQEQIENTVEQDGIESSLTEIFSDVSDWYDAAVTERNSYLFFSLYLVPDMNGTKHIYFGGLNHFVKVVDSI